MTPRGIRPRDLTDLIGIRAVGTPFADRQAVLLATGFRPFFLLAALLGAAWVPLWIAVLVGYAPIASHFGPVGWHSHEMIFGYAAIAAAIVLTLLTWACVLAQGGQA